MNIFQDFRSVGECFKKNENIRPEKNAFHFMYSTVGSGGDA